LEILSQIAQQNKFKRNASAIDIFANVWLVGGAGRISPVQNQKNATI
jgi:hypothetical protein